MPATPEELAPGVHRIDAIGISHMISVFAIRDDSGWTLVDTGVRSSPKRIQAALSALRVRPADLTTIYLTHHHSDHVGGALGMRAWAPDAEVVAPEHEAEVIAAERPMDPSSSRAFQLFRQWGSLPIVPVTRAVRPGATIAGFRVLATPGHTLGHTSLLSEQHGVLLTADAFGAMPRRLRVGVRAAFCTDPTLAKRSAEMLLGEEYRTVAFSHGPVLRDGPKDVLRQIVAACPYPAA